MESSHNAVNDCGHCHRKGRGSDIDPVVLMGMRVNLTTADNALQSLVQAFSGSHSSNTSTTVTFLNAHYINAAWNDPEYKSALSAFRWVVPDGVGLRMAARLAGLYPVANIPGTDLVPALLWHSKLEGARVFLLGHEPNAIARVTRNLIRSRSDRRTSSNSCGGCGAMSICLTKPLFRRSAPVKSAWTATPFY
jgi:UDP-N-acetyl-D-mannosaminuronic acid transferase (WecB/TagA/CpsF family)